MVWGLEVRDQDIGRAVLSLKPLGENLFHAFLSASGAASSLWHSLVVCRYITPVSACMGPGLSSLCVSVSSKDSPLSVSVCVSLLFCFFIIHSLLKYS